MQRRAWIGWLAAAGALPLAAPAQSGSGRVALVVGQSRLPGGGVVASAAANARLMEQALQQAGFSVVRLDDPDVGALRAGLAQLGARLRASPGLGLLYYSGAGFGQPMAGGNAEFWMWCAAAHSRQPDAKVAMSNAVPLREVWQLVDPGVGRALVVTADSGFNWPFGPVPSGGLRWPDAPRFGAVFFSDSPGAAGGEPADGQHGRFTQALARHLQAGLTVDQVQRAVSLAVRQASGGRQFITSNIRQLKWVSCIYPHQRCSAGAIHTGIYRSSQPGPKSVRVAQKRPTRTQSRSCGAKAPTPSWHLWHGRLALLFDAYF